MAPSHIRRRILGVSMVMAFMLYLDRICMAEIVQAVSFRRDLHLTPAQIGRVLAAFFLAYALAQVPAGWASDRWGARRMLTLFIALWSLATALTGIVTSLAGLLAARLLCGAAEAGAYPASSAIIRRWFPLRARARASAAVAMGGQIGGTVAPFITAWLVIRLGHWRPVLGIDAATGFAIAVLYYRVVRDRPAEHPQCNAAEAELIGRADDSRPADVSGFRPLGRRLLRHRTLWMAALMQLFLGTGWAFLITWLPTYLREQWRVEDVAGGRLVTLVPGCGVIGQLAGGCISDWGARTIGLKWCRALPLGGVGAVGGAAYIGCMYASSAPVAVACCAVVSFAVGVANPVIWALDQDIGGRITAAVFGFGNMCANLGSASISILVPWLMGLSSNRGAGSRLVFLFCAATLVLSGLAGLGCDASRPILAEGQAEADPQPRSSSGSGLR